MDKKKGVNPKDLIGVTKVPMHLFPSAGKIYGALAMQDGAQKYGPFNWRQYPVKMTIYCDAIERHLDALKDGEDYADDSGVHHLGHVLACAAIMLDAEACGQLVDDRPHHGKGVAADLQRKFKLEKTNA